MTDQTVQNTIDEYSQLTFSALKLLSARAAWAILHTGKTTIASQHVP